MAGKKEKGKEWDKENACIKMLQINPTTTSRITLNIYSFPRNMELINEDKYDGP